MFIGIDPSTKTGLVALDGNTILMEKEIASTKQGFDQSVDIAFQVELSLVSLEKKGPIEGVCIEGYSFNSPYRVVQMVEIGTLIRFKLRKKYGFIDVAPNTLKKFATGVGKGKKEAVLLHAYKAWGYENSSNNVVDGYVLARIAQAIVRGGESNARNEIALSLMSKK